MHWMSWFRRAESRRNKATQRKQGEHRHRSGEPDPQKLVELRAQRAFARYEDLEQRLMTTPEKDVAASG